MGQVGGGPPAGVFVGRAEKARWLFLTTACDIGQASARPTPAPVPLPLVEPPRPLANI